MPWKCHFLWMWSGAGFLPAIAALGCCDCAWSTRPHWMGCVFLQFSSCPLDPAIWKTKLPSSNAQGTRQSWNKDTGKVGGKQSEELGLRVRLGSKIGSLAWSACQRHLNVFCQDQEVSRAVHVFGLPNSLENNLGTGEIGKKGQIDLEKSFSASRRAAMAVRVASKAEGDR